MLVLQLWFSESSNWQSRASIWWPCVARISCSVEMTGRASSNFCFKPTPQVCCVGVDHVLLFKGPFQPVSKSLQIRFIS